MVKIIFNELASLFGIFLLTFPLIGTNASKLTGKYSSKTLEVRLNRLSVDTSSQNHFEIHYKVLDVFFTSPENDGPILVGICGQQSIEQCMDKMQDLLEDLAPRLNAAIIFVEHRFFGRSYQGYRDTNPDKSAYNKIEILRNLRVEEVLDDIREVVNDKSLKLGANPMQRAVLVGMDYAGALALWMNMQKQSGKEKPRFTWAASPSPLAMWSDASMSPRFDQKLAELLKQFGCQLPLVHSLFQWMDDTAKPGDANGLATVKKAFCYDGEETTVAPVKDNVLQLLRLFAAWQNRPDFDYKVNKFVWPLETMCNLLETAPNATKRAEAFGKFMLARQLPGLTKFKYQQAINEGLNDDELRAKNFQKCTEMPAENCAAGAKNDPFYKQCQPPKDYIKTMCKTKWLDSLSGYNADTEVQPNFIKNTFGFDFSKLQNVLITTAQFDQYSAVLNPPKSNPKQNFFVFPSMPLAFRGRELQGPTTCDPLALGQFRTQVADILVCLFHPHSSVCAQKPKWPAALTAETRQQDAKHHVKKCAPLRWQYPWAAYGPPGPTPKPKPPKNGAGRTGTVANKETLLGALSIATVAVMTLFLS